MNNHIAIFNSLVSRTESEVVEFKKAENSFDFDDLGKYFSALSNEANLRGLEFAWLIFGYDEKKHAVVGTSFKDGEGALNKLKHDFSQHTTDGQTFREIVPIEIEGKRVLMFKIPASPRNIVMKWKGIAYARDGESLKPLNQSKQDEIRHQTPEPDWSAEIVSNATIDDLDEVAIAKAKMMFKKVHNRIPAEEVNKWSTEEFLSKCELMADGKLRRAAIILLGKMFSDSKLRPAVAEVTWTLRDEKKDVVDYEHFSVPFILTVDEILAKIHNLTLREMPGGTLFPDTMKQYDDYTISLGVAKASKQLTGYTKVKGLERDKIKQMILQYIQNAGSDGAKRDAIMEYLEGTLPSRNTDEQNTELVSNILREMKDEKIIVLKGRLWIYENK